MGHMKRNCRSLRRGDPAVDNSTGNTNRNTQNNKRRAREIEEGGTFNRDHEVEKAGTPRKIRRSKITNFMVVATTNEGGVDEKYLEWIYDTGSTGNYTQRRDLFCNEAVNLQQYVQLLTGDQSLEVHQGSVLIRMTNAESGQLEDKILTEVNYHPGATANIISSHYLRARGFRATFTDIYDAEAQLIVDGKLCVQKEGVILEFFLKDNLYKMCTSIHMGQVEEMQQKVPFLLPVHKFTDGINLAVMTRSNHHNERVNATSEIPLSTVVLPVSGTSTNNKITDNSLLRWHGRMGHAHAQCILDMVRRGRATGVELSAKEKNGNFECLSCPIGKFKRMSYKNTQPCRSIKLWKRIYTDIGFVNTPTYAGNIGYQFFVDEASATHKLVLVASKTEATENTKAFVEHVLLHYDNPVKFIVADRGTEFTNQDLRNYCAKNSIELTYTMGYSPEENSPAERANYTLMDKVRTCLLATGLPTQLWGEAAHWVNDTYDVTPTLAANGYTPYEMRTGMVPDLSRLRTWGCLCYGYITTEKRSRAISKKLAARGKAYLFVGYSTLSHNGYRLLDLTTGAIQEQRFENIVFHEDYTVSSDHVQKLLENKYCGNYHTIPTTFDHQNIVPLPICKLPVAFQPMDTADDVRGAIRTMANQSARSVHFDSTVHDTLTGQSTHLPQQNTPTTPDEEASGSIEDTIDEDETSSNRDHGTYIIGGNMPMMTSYMATDKIAAPTTYKQMLKSPQVELWKEAMRDEYRSLMKNGTWEVVPIPQGRNILSSKWVFVLKKNAQGEIVRYKARLVVRGFEQVYKVDYDNTWAPVVRHETLRLALLISMKMGYTVSQLDVKTAFLNGKLEEVIYMDVPSGFDFLEPATTGKRVSLWLLKSLYGLKQAPRCWNAEFHDCLVNDGFVRSQHDYGLYLKKVGEKVMFLTVYVDDILLLGSKQFIDHTTAILKKRFEISDLGTVKYLLGIEIKCKDNKVIYSQRKYINEILEKFNLEDSNAVATPQVLGSEPEPNSFEDTRIPYRNLVGALQYLVAGTRPELGNVVRVLSKYLNCYGQAQWKMAKRVLRFLKGTAHYCLVHEYKQTGTVEVTAYSDADFANDKGDRKSITGYCVFVDGCLISSKSKKQSLVATSTTYAETIAANEGAKEVLWISSLLTEMGVKFGIPTLFVDNSGAVAWTDHPGSHERTKHVETRYHALRGYVQDKKMVVKQVSTNEMVADVFTKPLPEEKMVQFMRELKVQPLLVHSNGVCELQVTTPVSNKTRKRLSKYSRED